MLLGNGRDLNSHFEIPKAMLVRKAMEILNVRRDQSHTDRLGFCSLSPIAVSSFSQNTLERTYSLKTYSLRLEGVSFHRSGFHSLFENVKCDFSCKTLEVKAGGWEPQFAMVSLTLWLLTA